MTVRRLKWEQAAHIQERTGFKTQIEVDGVFYKFEKAKSMEDYAGLTNYVGNENKCYVQEYTIGDDNFLAFVKNPVIYQRRKLETKSIKKHFEELLYNQEYFSLMYSTIGKRAYVGAWCDEYVRVKKI